MNYSGLFPLDKKRRIFISIIMFFEGLFFGLVIMNFAGQVQGLYQSLGVEMPKLFVLTQYPLLISIPMAAGFFLFGLYFLNNSYHFINLPYSEKLERRMHILSVLYSILIVAILAVVVYWPIYAVGDLIK